mgnify:CR=1 FL=1
MRRPTSALTTAILGTALMVLDLPAQQMPPAGSASTSGKPSTVTPTMLARGPSYLLHNGWDYITYQEYERALDYFRSVGDAPDRRMDEAVELVRSKRQPDGTWLLENTHPGEVHFALADGDGRARRWNTLRAPRVLRWVEGAAT